MKRTAIFFALALCGPALCGPALAGSALAQTPDTTSACAADRLE